MDTHSQPPQRQLTRTPASCKGAITVLALGFSLGAINVHAQQLSSLMQMVKTHPSVQNATALAGAAKDEIAVAQAASKLKLGGGVSVADGNSVSGVSSGFAPQLTATLPLGDGGKTSDNVRAKTALSDAAMTRIRVSEESIGTEVLTLYTQVAKQQAVIQALSQHGSALQVLLDKVKAIAQIDTGRRSEVLQVQTKLNAVLSSREESRLIAKQALTKLQQLLQTKVAVTAPVDPPRVNFLIPATMAQAQTLLANHPALQAAAAESLAAQARADAASKWNNPSWALEAAAASAKDINSGKQKYLNAVTVRLSANLDILDGGAGAATANSEAQLRAGALANIETVQRNLSSTLGTELNLLTLREQRLAQLRAQVTTANELRVAGFEQFLAGRRALTEQINFENDYFSALIALAGEEVEQQSAPWRLVSALGQLGGVLPSSTKGSTTQSGTTTNNINPTSLQASTPSTGKPW